MLETISDMPAKLEAKQELSSAAIQVKHCVIGKTEELKES